MLRQQLKAAGFAPIPLTGKVPAFAAWQTKTDAPISEIEAWTKQYPGSQNTGVLTARTPAIDIDITNEEAAEAVEHLARERFEERGHFLVRIGKPPKRAILLRTNQPFKKIKTTLIAPNGANDQKIELLADGQQIACFGEHPDTKQPYTWHGGEPGKIAREDLPYISEDEARAFMQDAARLLINDFGFTEPRAKNNGDATDNEHRASWNGLVANIITGADLHDATRDLAAAIIASGMNTASAERLLYGLMNASTTPRDARWQARLADISRAVASAREKFGAEPRCEPQSRPADDVFTLLGDAPACPPRELIKKLLPADGVAVLGGQSGAGKTFLEIHKAVCLATGLPFFGYKIVERVGTVLVAAEGRSLIPNRYAATLAGLNVADKLPIACVKNLPDLANADSIRQFIHDLKTLDERFRGEFGRRLGQFTVDTITATFGMKDEDDNSEATRVCNVLRRIYEETGALACGVHHYGKNPESGLRGASAFKGCAEIVIGALADIDPLSGAVSDRELVCTKARDGEQGPISPFELEFIRLGLDPDGEIYGSMHVVPDEKGKSRFDKAGTKLSKGQRIIRDAITEALDGRSRAITPRAGMPSVKAARVADVQDEFTRRYVVPSKGRTDSKKGEHAKYMAFRRALDALPIKEFGAGSAEGEDWIWRAT